MSSGGLHGSRTVHVLRAFQERFRSDLCTFESVTALNLADMDYEDWGDGFSACLVDRQCMCACPCVSASLYQQFISLLRWHLPQKLTRKVGVGLARGS